MKETKQSNKFNVEVTSDFVTFTSFKSLSSGNKFRDIDRVRNFIPNWRVNGGKLSFKKTRGS
jgi:hypothetical protein